MKKEPDFSPVPPRPKGWEDVFAITRQLRNVPIEEIQNGRVDWEYHFDSKDMRPCGRKGCEQRHAHGWIVALPDHRFVHIGNNCAEKYADAGLWASNVSICRKRMNAEARIAALLEARDEAQRKQFWLDNTPEVDAAIAIYESFVQQARGSLLQEVERRAERGYSIIEKDRFLTVDEIQIRRAMLAGSRVENEPGPYVASSERVAVGELVGLQCFRPQGSPREIRSQLQRLVECLLTWSPAEDDRDAQRSLVQATRELAPLSNRLNSSLVAVRRFFSESNLKALMLLDVTRSQGITSIELDGIGGLVIKRRAHWKNVA
ncbi:hypothetical protein [Xanthomonas sontii]|uniref:hypothetical protein n=2 Tax=Xanthomonas TaxID=338 RepID=UPI00123D64CB|nr:hypothetical protein [Xanthomonas sontii]